MSPEVTALALFAALLLFAIAAVIAFLARNTWAGLISAGLACWVLVPFWNALDAL